MQRHMQLMLVSDSDVEGKVFVINNKLTWGFILCPGFFIYLSIWAKRSNSTA